MKKQILLFLALCFPMMLMAQNKVAVYVMSSTDNVKDNVKKIVGCELVAAIVNTKQYKAVERTSDFLQQINKEQNYQRSGNVDDDQISALGKQFGVDYVCVANIMPYKNTYYVQARVIDVETATVLSFARITSSLLDLDDIISSVKQLSDQLIDNIKSN